jgi:hypothetical protein
MAIVLGLAQVCAAQMFNNIKDLVQRISPAVVTILSLDKDRQLFGYGSGFVIKANGLIASNYHVVKGAHFVNVKTHNGDTFDVAGIVDIDPDRDFVILKIAGYDLPAVTLGNSNDVEIGDPVIAIGNPRGLEHTVSNGIVSQRRQYEGFTFLQITVPISQGSSGGPLVNMNGEVIGMASLTMQEGQNLNFALPINYIRGALENNSTVKYTLAEVTAWQDQQDAEELQRQMDKVVTVYQDPDAYFSMVYPRTWRAYRSEGWEKDGNTFHKITIFVPPQAHRAEVNGYISEGVRVHFQVPKKGKV